MTSYEYNNEKKFIEYGKRVLTKLTSENPEACFANFNGSIFLGMMQGIRKLAEDNGFEEEVDTAMRYLGPHWWGKSFPNGYYTFDDGTTVEMVVARGAQKIALIFEVEVFGADLEFAHFLDNNVLKLDQNSLETILNNNDTPNLEPSYYAAAVEWGLDKFFAKTSGLGEALITHSIDLTDEFPESAMLDPSLFATDLNYTILFFWQEKMEEIEFGEDTQISEETADSTTYISYSGYEYLTDHAILILDEKYGTTPEIEDLLGFIDEYGINDLHSGNIGKSLWTDDFMLWDFCGWA